MTTIDSIHLDIQTADLSGAGTDGGVFLGFAGREFRVDSDADDYERGSSRSYVLGAGATVREAQFNDPRNPQLTVESVEHFPTYLRFDPPEGDNWCLRRAVVHLNGQVLPQWETGSHLPLSAQLWLGVRSGLVVHLLKHDGGSGPIL